MLYSCLKWELHSFFENGAWTLDSCLRWTLDSCLRWTAGQLFEMDPGQFFEIDSE